MMRAERHHRHLRPKRESAGGLPFLSGFVRLRELPAHNQKADQMCQEGQQPGDRVREEKHLWGMIFGNPENRCNPKQAQTAGTEHGNDGRRNSIAHATNGADDGIHHTAEAVGGTDDAETDHSGINGSRCVRVNAQERAAEEVGEVSEYQTGSNRTALGTEENSVDTGVFLSTDILAGKGQSGLMEGVHGYPDKAFDARRSRASGNDDFTEAVDGGLDDNIGKGENHSLKSGRKTDAHQGNQGRSVNAQLSKDKPEGFVFFRHQTTENERCRHVLRKDGCKRNAGNVHMEYNDK